MGASFHSKTYPPVSFQELEKLFSKDSDRWTVDLGSHHTSGHLGMKSGIVNTGLLFKTRDEAYNYVLEHTDKYDSEALAVRVGDFSALEHKSAKHKNLAQKILDAHKELNQIESDVSDTQRKLRSPSSTVAFVTCRDCKSKIAAKFVKTKDCPICLSYNFLYTPKQLAAIKKHKEVIENGEKVFAVYRNELLTKNPELKKVGWFIGSWVPE